MIITDLQQQAFTDLLDAHQGILIRMSRVYSRNESDRKDLFQEMVFQLWRAWPNYRGEAAASTWMYRVALNTALKFYSLLRRKKDRSMELSAISFEPSHQDTPEQQVERDSQVDRLYACISQLPEPDRTIVLMYLEELPYREIAQVTGLTENHVAVKMKRAKSKLFNCLNA
ncbi:sigma-70 family RNA polymerase sigma factor [Pontibacter sp. G13]|uniref:RNA polymerase sigma factor n=1 Tax=Pontibacter sp. G13 TaxID=3074898 RepID=UPI00288A4F24|nr:sigma-70 family RNA polymerase sigma factor [Pontibacter sp. G13]WNJ18177.1 sigma-70 family RNA polymerase sigma factor [Pontibacter sp. G13]